MAKVLKRRQPRGKPRVGIYRKEPVPTSIHWLVWAKDGNLLESERRGDYQRIPKGTTWPQAKAMAAAKARQIGATKRKYVGKVYASFSG